MSDVISSLSPRTLGGTVGRDTAVPLQWALGKSVTEIRMKSRGMNENGAIRAEVASLRRRRLEQALGPVQWEPAEALSNPGRLIAVTSSRLGDDSSLHYTVGRFLASSARECHQRAGTWVIAKGSAIEPWAIRAAELFAVPLLSIEVDSKQVPGERASGGAIAVTVRSRMKHRLCRDEVLIALADRVDAAYVRRGGTIERCLRSRLARQCEPITRVAVTFSCRCASLDLMNAGAVGWLEPSMSPPSGPRSSSVPTCGLQLGDQDWTQGEGNWLVHCTRGVNGPWPGETVRQYRDSILLGGREAINRGPLSALARIARSGRLMASSAATRKSHPVVCFSEMSLARLLAGRCYRPHLRRWDYEPYGVAIRITAAKQAGIRPVIYGQPEDRQRLPASDRFRFHPVGKTYDWTREREWRAPGSVDLNRFRPEDVRVFVSQAADLLSLPQPCPWAITVLSPADAP